MVTLFLLTIAATTIVALVVRKRREAIYQKQRSSITTLRMQNARNTMSPHFFFNVLASFYGMAYQPEQLKVKVKSLSKLLRTVIENIDCIAIPAGQELETVKAYIDLYKGKIPDPFMVEYLIEEGANLERLIPAMVIQIPVENAIKHGLMPLNGEKKLILRIAESEDCQTIEIEDNGIGLKASEGHSTGTGTGLKVLLQTIHLLNAGNSRKIKFELNDRGDADAQTSGTIVRIEIPFDFNYKLMRI